MGIGASDGQLGAVRVCRRECQTARLNFVGDVLVEGIAGDKG